MIIVAAEGGGPLDSLDQFVGLGVGGVMLWFVGRQMIRLWSAWGDFAKEATTRSSSDEKRADDLQVKLSECSIALAQAVLRCEYQEREIARLMAVISEVRNPGADDHLKGGEDQACLDSVEDPRHDEAKRHPEADQGQ